MTDDLGEALRARRRALELRDGLSTRGSLTALAAELGEDAAVVSQWLLRPPKGPIARALARAISAHGPLQSPEHSWNSAPPPS